MFDFTVYSSILNVDVSISCVCVCVNSTVRMKNCMVCSWKESCEFRSSSASLVNTWKTIT